MSSPISGVHKEDRAKVVQWSMDFIHFLNVLPITVEPLSGLRGIDFDYTKTLLADGASIAGRFSWHAGQRHDGKGRLHRDEIISNAMLLLWPGM